MSDATWAVIDTFQSWWEMPARSLHGRTGRCTRTRPASSASASFGDLLEFARREDLPPELSPKFAVQFYHRIQSWRSRRRPSWSMRGWVRVRGLRSTSM